MAKITEKIAKKTVANKGSKVRKRATYTRTPSIPKGSKKINVNPTPELDENSKDPSERIAARIIKGLEVKYDPNRHCPMLIKIFTTGGEICHFCSDAEIVRSTFFEWVNKHKEFELAYNMAREKAYKFWMELTPNKMMEDNMERFNFNVWRTVMRNRFGFTEHRKIALPRLKSCKSHQARIDCIVDYISEGELTAQESTHLANLILAALKVDENTNLQERLEKAEQLIKEKL